VKKAYRPRKDKKKRAEVFHSASVVSPFGTRGDGKASGPGGAGRRNSICLGKSDLSRLEYIANNLYYPNSKSKQIRDEARRGKMKERGTLPRCARCAKFCKVLGSTTASEVKFICFDFVEKEAAK
jgi:hypothetical protein